MAIAATSSAVTSATFNHAQLQAAISRMHAKPGGYVMTPDTLTRWSHDADMLTRMQADRETWQREHNPEQLWIAPSIDPPVLGERWKGWHMMLAVYVAVGVGTVAYLWWRASMVVG